MCSTYGASFQRLPHEETHASANAEGRHTMSWEPAHPCPGVQTLSTSEQWQKEEKPFKMLKSHLEKVEIDLFSICILFLVDTGEEIFHIQHYSQESVHFFFWHILQVGNMSSLRQRPKEHMWKFSWKSQTFSISKWKVLSHKPSGTPTH